MKCLHNWVLRVLAPTLCGCGLFFSPATAQQFDWNDLQPGHWYEIPNTKMRDVTPNPCVHSGTWPSCSKVGNVMEAWSGGSFDTTRDYFLIFGGGHADYGGNEIYAFDVNSLGWLLLSQPSYDLGGDVESGVYPDGSPRSRHTYNFIQYVPPIDKFCSLGAGGLYPSGNTSTDRVDCFDYGNPNTVSHGWFLKGRMPHKGKSGSQSAYDPVRERIWHQGNGSRDYLSEWDPVSNVWTVRTKEQAVFGGAQSMDIDPIKRLAVSVGNGLQRYYNIDESGQLTPLDLNSTGPQNVVNQKAPGFEYDSGSGKFIGWASGTSLYSLDFETRQWRECPPAASNTVSPTSPQNNGTFGRFQYIPSKNAFILVNDIDQDVFVYKLSTSCGGGGVADDSPPTVPQGLQAFPESETSISMQWQAAADPETGVSAYRVYRDGAKVAQTNTTSYVDSGLNDATSYTYTVSAVNGAGLASAESTPASATTLSDTTPPTLVSADASGDPTRVVVVYSEPVDQVSAETTSNYSIDNGIVVLGASLQPDPTVVVLTTSDHIDEVAYMLTVSNVRDRARNPNTIAAGSQVGYSFDGGVIISNIVTESGENFEVGRNLSVGSTAYIDRSYVYDLVPGELVGHGYIRTANGDKDYPGTDSFLSFDVNQDVTVYVGHDDRYTLRPDWLNSFVATGQQLSVSGAGNFDLFARDFPVGTVVLGANQHPDEIQRNSMYVIAIVDGGGVDPGNPPAAPGGLQVR